jgi:hypothetical protein
MEGYIGKSKKWLELMGVVHFVAGLMGHWSYSLKGPTRQLGMTREVTR